VTDGDRFPGKLLSAAAYAAAQAQDAGFETVCAQARQNQNIRFMRRHMPGTVLEIGCGSLLMVDRVRQEALPVTRFVTVEPAQCFADLAIAAAADDHRFVVVRAYVEECLPELVSLVPEGYEAVLLSGVVHETSMPLALLASAAALLKRDGHILVSVPNAHSFHRLLAVEMGLIASPAELSRKNRLLGQPAVYTRASLCELLREAGLVPLTFEGYLFKPFANDQMVAIQEMLPDGIIDALDSLGRAFPDNAAEICFTCKKA
jgi:hypothetical protein